MSGDFEQYIQHKAEAHLEACITADDPFFEDEPEGESPATAPFCGCTTCIVREVLSVCWDEMVEEVERTHAHAASGTMPRLQLVREGDAVCDEPRPAHD